ncbi:SMP-30/gluconolactonase/LRE family protein [Runella salmonicolor]|uniref:Gluconolaconase n=1 Tax=Runella salmonicolor TaxID=2950278 RepID=A0ABT1FK00_9BACT|nr:gluconolaconase [Runella salmonicolor]MCP1382103.1 gluconolaconase [Runella salmonicolor]
MKTYIFILSLLSYCLFTPAFSQDRAPVSLNQLWKSDTLLRTPESVQYDPQGKRLFVANMNKVNVENPDGDGFISVLSTDGKIKTLQWATGLNDPKGMGIIKNSLFVADLKDLVEIDLKTGKILNRHAAVNSIMLNDVSISPKGEVFVSDSRGHKLYRYADGKMELFLDDPNLQGPNGVFAEKEQLIVASAGSGNLWKMDYATKKYTSWAMTNKTADGILRFGDDYLISCWHGEVYYVKPDGKVWKLIDSKSPQVNTADFGYIPQTKTVLIPNFYKNTVTAYTIK